MNCELTHYEVLGIDKSASAEQIKQAYHAAVLKHHPDKAGAALAGESSSVSSADGHGFMLIQKAWEILRDADQRAAYDSAVSLRDLQAPLTYQDELDADEMDVELHNGEEVLTYRCRCGDQYTVRKAELANNDTMVVPCRTCSNHVLVTVRSL